jgi:hypothetical protein
MLPGAQINNGWTKSGPSIMERRMTLAKLKQQVLQRDKFTCQRCDTADKKLLTHHKITIRNGGTDTLDNLITYCFSCHKIVEPPRKMGYPTKVTKGFTIRMGIALFERIRKLGMKGEKYEEIVERAISLYEKEQKKK